MKKHVNNFLIICFVFGITTQVDAFTFTRTLTVGSSGQDVFELQKILNQNSQTQVATIGAGSPGQETIYFGELTRQAVIKFQNLYATNILHPVGLTTGTGFVGSSTLNFLNNLSNSNSTPNIVPPNTSTNTTTPVQNNNTIQPSITIITQEDLNNLPIAQVPNAQKAALFFPTVFASHPAKEVRRNGRTVLVDQDITILSGFKIHTLDFYLGTQQLKKECQNEYICTVWIAKDTQPGTYILSTNEPNAGTHEFKIISMNIKKPVVSVKNIKIGEDILITGEHFTDTMIVYTIFGAYQTQTLNNSFILNISDKFVLPKPIQGVLYVENSYGLPSDTIVVQYEK